jgi:arylsulfatase A-like enzyme
MVRRPGRIKAVERHHVASGWLPTLLPAAGMPDIKELLAGYRVGEMTVHLDGYNFLPYTG